MGISIYICELTPCKYTTVENNSTTDSNTQQYTCPTSCIWEGLTMHSTIYLRSMPHLRLLATMFSSFSQIGAGYREMHRMVCVQEVIGFGRDD